MFSFWWAKFPTNLEKHICYVSATSPTMTCNKQQVRPCTITTCDAIGDYRFSLGGPYHLTVFRVCPELFSILLLRFGSVALRIVDMHLVVQQRQRFMLVSFQNHSETKTPKQMMRKNTDLQKHQLEPMSCDYDTYPIAVTVTTAQYLIDMQELSHCTLPPSALLWFY